MGAWTVVEADDVVEVAAVAADEPVMAPVAVVALDAIHPEPLVRK